MKNANGFRFSNRRTFRLAAFLISCFSGQDTPAEEGFRGKVWYQNLPRISELKVVEMAERKPVAEAGSQIGDLIRLKEQQRSLRKGLPKYSLKNPHPFKGRLDGFVEGQRRRAVAEVIRYLRAKTSEDLGPDPEKWLFKYGSESVKENLKIMKEDSKTNPSKPTVQRMGASRLALETNRTSSAAGSGR